MSENFERQPSPENEPVNIAETLRSQPDQTDLTTILTYQNPHQQELDQIATSSTVERGDSGARYSDYWERFASGKDKEEIIAEDPGGVWLDAGGGDQSDPAEVEHGQGPSGMKKLALKLGSQVYINVDRYFLAEHPEKRTDELPPDEELEQLHDFDPNPQRRQMPEDPYRAVSAQQFSEPDSHQEMLDVEVKSDALKFTSRLPTASIDNIGANGLNIVGDDKYHGALVQEFDRALKPGGRIFLSEGDEIIEPRLRERIAQGRFIEREGGIFEKIK